VRRRVAGPESSAGLSEAWDKNQNGYVCAFDLRGTRAYVDDPCKSFTYFGVSDDKIRK
jgi:hypothetical protein